VRALRDDCKDDGSDDAREEGKEDENAEADSAKGQEEEGDLLPEIFLDVVLRRLVKVHLHWVARSRIRVVGSTG
jgi:hypothetical protein